MKNRRALFSVLVPLTVLTMAVIACEEDDKSEFPGSDKPDTGVGDTGPGFRVDAKPEDTNVSCRPALPSSFAPTFKFVDHKDACTRPQLTAYYSECLANDAEGNSKIKTTGCSDWLAAAENADCGKCIEAPDNTGPVQIYNDRLYFGLNNAGCVAIKQKNGAVGSCAEKYDTAASCRRLSCQSCLEKENATFQNFLTCQSDSIKAGGDCAEYQANAFQTCGESGYKDAGSSNNASDCFGKDENEAQGDVFVRVEEVFCLKP